jgi:hypothetical protein
MCKVTSKRRAVSPLTTELAVRSERGSFTTFHRLASSPLPVASQGCWIPEWPNEFKLPFQPTRLELTSPPTIHGPHGPGLDRATSGPMPATGAVRPDRPARVSAFESTPCFRPTRLEQTQSPRPRRPSPTRPIRVPLLNPHFLQFPRSRLMMSGAWRLRSKKRSTSPVCMHLARAWAGPQQGAAGLERTRAPGALRLWLPGVLDLDT